jgi:hypothetical protein
MEVKLVTLGNKIQPRDSIATFVNVTEEEKNLEVDAFIAGLATKKYHHIRTESMAMPSNQSGAVIVTHVYYREVLPI